MGSAPSSVAGFTMGAAVVLLRGRAGLDQAKPPGWFWGRSPLATASDAALRTALAPSAFSDSQRMDGWEAVGKDGEAGVESMVVLAVRRDNRLSTAFAPSFVSHASRAA